jgi:hypothetical protein
VDTFGRISREALICPGFLTNDGGYVGLQRHRLLVDFLGTGGRHPLLKMLVLSDPRLEMRGHCHADLGIR